MEDTKKEEELSLSKRFRKGLRAGVRIFLIGSALIITSTLVGVWLFTWGLEGQHADVKKNIDAAFWPITIVVWLLMAAFFFLWPLWCRRKHARETLDKDDIEMLVDVRWKVLMWFIILEILFAFDTLTAGFQGIASVFS